MLNAVSDQVADTPSTSLAQRVLCWAGVVFLFVSPFASSIALRNVSLAVALIAAITVILRERATLPRLPRSILGAGIAWISVCLASWFWSVDRTYTAGEFRPELLFPLLAFSVFWVGARREAARFWISALLAGVAILGTLAIGEKVIRGSWDAARWHAGVGAYSTWLVMVFPLVLTIALPKGMTLLDLGAKRWPIFALLLMLIVGSAYLTLNRIVWPAFVVVFLAFGLSCLPALLAKGREHRRLLLTGAALFVGLALVFAIVMKHRADSRAIEMAATTHSSLEKDPRVELWRHVVRRIGDSPINGHGFGRGILRQELQSAHNQKLLWHGHNVVLNVLLQTGVIGLTVFVALWGAFAFRYIIYVRSGAPELNAIGAIGLAFLAGFLVKNMTDDFLVRHTGLLFWAMNAMLIGYGERVLCARHTASKQNAALS